jgi:hypothetical protein
MDQGEPPLPRSRAGCADCRDARQRRGVARDSGTVWPDPAAGAICVPTRQTGGTTGPAKTDVIPSQGTPVFALLSPCLSQLVSCGVMGCTAI